MESAPASQGASRNRPRITRLGVYAIAAAITFTAAGFVLIDGTLIFLGAGLVLRRDQGRGMGLFFNL